VLACAASAAACNERHRVDHGLWTLFDIRAAFEADDSTSLRPTGISAGSLLERSADGSVHLRVQRAFAAGQPAAFVTTEIWLNYDDGVWLQPLYAQLLDARTLLPDAPRIIDVGPDSSFYSPFWQVSLAVVGDVPADHYRSSKQILDMASAIVPAPAHTCPLRPLDMPGRIALPPPWDAWEIALPDIPVGEAVYDDGGASARVGLFDFGVDLFSVQTDARLGNVVDELAMFAFADDLGVPLASAPRVAGDGPRPGGGALWRIYEATLPSGAGPFHAAEHAAAIAALAPGSDALELEGRVALDTRCFDDAARFPGGCVWLDSQAQLESMLGAGRLTRTPMMATGLFVLHGKQAVLH
jgi:hypothetical protein